MKNIVYIYNHTSIHTGSPRSLLDHVKFLNKKLFKPIIIIPRKGEIYEKAKEYNIDTFFLKSVSLSSHQFISFIKSFFLFIILFIKERIHIVHMNSPGWRDSAVLAAKILRIPIVLHIRNDYSPDLVKANFNFALCDKIVIISKSMQNIFKYIPKISKKVVCIYNGIDINLFKPSVVDLSCKFVDKNNYFIIGFVGQISHRKGLDLLIKVAPLVTNKFSHIRFLIVGTDGVNEDGLSKSYQNEIEQMKLHDYFDFLGKRQDIPEIMNFIDLLVVPSRKEPFGKVIVEAMACKKCVIASNVGGIPEIITDKFNGLLFKNEDEGDFAKCLKTVISNDSFRKYLAENGYNTARTRYSTDTLINNIQNLYKKLI